MRVAAIYDIHANLPALEAVLGEIEGLGVDQIIIGGDVLPGPMPRETLDLLDQLTQARFLRGNGESDVLSLLAGHPLPHLPEQAYHAVEWTASALSAEDVAQLETWPADVRLDLPGIGEVLFCHATPRSDRELFTAQTPRNRLLEIFETAASSWVVCGHTHMQFDLEIGNQRVVNAGSVGMPFGRPGAYWLLLDGDVQLRRTSYDLVAAAERLRASAYPQASAFADRNVIAPPTEAEMIELFEKATRA